MDELEFCLVFDYAFFEPSHPYLAAFAPGHDLNASLPTQYLSLFLCCTSLNIKGQLNWEVATSSRHHRQDKKKVPDLFPNTALIHPRVFTRTRSCHGVVLLPSQSSIISRLLCPCVVASIICTGLFQPYLPDLDHRLCNSTLSAFLSCFGLSAFILFKLCWISIKTIAILK